MTHENSTTTRSPGSWSVVSAALLDEDALLSKTWLLLTSISDDLTWPGELCTRSLVLGYGQRARG